MLTDEQLALAAKAGDTFAYEELLKKYKGLVCKKCKAYYVENSSKEDVMQTVCDYVSGMTDRYVLIKYEENFLPSPLIPQSNDEFLFKLANMNGLK